MDRVFESGAAGSPPSAPASPSSGYPTAGNPQTATPATKPGPWWYHMIAEEILSVIEAAGLPPSHTDTNQLLDALRAAGVFQTAPQFDNDTSVATTEFVQRALGNYAGWANISSNGTTISASAAGIFHNVTVTAVSTNLPLLSAVPVGAAFHFKNTGGASTNMINASGADTIIVDNTAVAGVNVRNGEDLTVVKISSASWFAFGSSVLKYAESFSRSIASNGYQKLPGGLIIQWGTITGVAYNATDQTFNFPISFPTACLGIVSKGYGSVGVTVFTDVNIQFFGTEGVSNYQASSNAGSGTVNFRWLAIGY